jgi:hypothetical protein
MAVGGVGTGETPDVIDNGGTIAAAVEFGSVVVDEVAVTPEPEPDPNDYSTTVNGERVVPVESDLSPQQGAAWLGYLRQQGVLNEKYTPTEYAMMEKGWAVPLEALPVLKESQDTDS